MWQIQTLKSEYKGSFSTDCVASVEYWSVCDDFCAVIKHQPSGGAHPAEQH